MPAVLPGTTIVPEEELPPQETAPPVEAAPPPSEAAAPAPTAALPGTTIVPEGETPPAPAPAAEPAPGPFESAVRGVGDALGGAIAPVMAVAPEPVQNLANIVGQPVGGLVDAATNVTGAIGQGESAPEVAMQAIAPFVEPWRKGVDVVGERLIQGQSPVASPQEIAADPTGALSILPGLASTYGPAPAVSGVSEEAWVRDNPEAAQAAYEAGGGEGLREAWLTATNASDLPPPTLSNPLDAATSQNPVERAGQVLGALPEMAGGYLQAGQQGTLGPFLLGQAQAIAEDPLTLLDLGAAAPAARAVGRGVTRLPVVGPAVQRATQLAPVEEARLGRERAGTAGEALLRSREDLLAEEARLGGPPPIAPAAEAIPPPGRGELPQDLAEQVEAGYIEYGEAASLQRVRDRQALPTQAQMAQDPRRARTPAGREVSAPFRAGPGVTRRLIGEPDTPRAMIDQVTRSEGGRPTQRYTARLIDESRDVARGTAFDTLDEAMGYVDRALRDTPEPTAPTTGRVLTEPAPATPAPPSANAIGLMDGVWHNAQGGSFVKKHPTTGARTVLDPRFVPQLERAYRAMFDAPSEEFALPYPAKATDVTVPLSDEGIHARYRGAMTQGLFMLDDWPAAKVARAFPDAALPAGRIDWPTVERQLTSRNPQTQLTARRALAGKRHSELYTHRIANAPDPDLEVRNLVLLYHLDQVGGRFDAPQFTNTSYWRDRAAALAEAITDAGYMPTREGLAALRGMNLAEEARAAFPDLPETALQRFQGAPFLTGREGLDIAVRTPQGETIPVAPVVGEGLTGGITPAAAPDETTPVEAAPPPQVTPPPRPDAVAPPQEVAQRQTVRAAYGAAPAEARAALDAALETTENPVLSGYGVPVAQQDLALLSENATGKYRFRDGSAPRPGLTREDVILATLSDVEQWAHPELLTDWGRGAEGKLTRHWQDLDRKLNPDGALIPEDFSGTDPGRYDARRNLALRTLDDAERRAGPEGRTPGRLERLNQQYLGFVRPVMLFNLLNGPKYTLQNMLTNSVNIRLRGGGARVALSMFTRPAEMTRIFRNQKSGYKTFWNAIEQETGWGTQPNIPMNQRAALERLNVTPSPILDKLSRVFAPETARFIWSIPDQLGREHVATHVATREFRKLNQELPGIVAEEMRRRGVHVPEAKVRQVVRDFLDGQRGMTDPNTGKPYTNFLGRPARYEPIWNPAALRDHLRAHLTEDMKFAPDAGQFNRALNMTLSKTKTRQAAIRDLAGETVDRALFSWRNTNADLLLSRVTLYHYWMSRQGGLYVSEALKRPWVLAAYGRMMEEFEQQAAELDQPAWLKGFFQVQNSVAGFSTWFSPFDLASSLLTFADWQYEAGDDPFKDLTALGKAGDQFPYFVHPLLSFVAYELGLLGPDAYAPSVTGLETFGAKAAELLNYANAHDMLPEWVNAAGIGVDANGNKMPIPVRSLQELYAKWGNAISTALEPITGLTPVEVSNALGSQQRNIASIGETETWKAHPEWDPNDKERQIQVANIVQDALMDQGSDEYQAWFRIASEMPYQGNAALPGIVQGASRLISPVQTYTWPEQYNVDRWEGLQPRGEVPIRTGYDSSDPQAEYVYNALKYSPTSTPEARQLAIERNEYYAIMPPPLKDAGALRNSIGYGSATEDVTVGGVTYTPDDLAAMDDDARWDLADQALTDAGYSKDDYYASRDAQDRYLAAHPDLAAYEAYKQLIREHPGGVQGFVEETARSNPGFAQFVRSSMMNHATGEIDYSKVEYPDAYLASQGVRPSVYSPVVGNEPSMVPGGYPELAGLETGRPLLPQATVALEAPLFASPSDADQGYFDDPPIAYLTPGLPMQVLDATPNDSGMIQVAIGDRIGWVDSTLLQNASPARPTAPATQRPMTVQPSGGLAGLAGGVTSQLGVVKDALGNAVASLAGHNSGTPTKPAASTTAPGSYDVVPANDGIGVQSTIASDRTWMEQMVGEGNAIVTTDYKGDTPGPWYSYQEGHGADSTTHAAYDISCDTGYRADGSSTCPGTAIKAPLAGRVVCSGYGQGTGESLAGCTYSQATTNPTNERGEPSAHTVVLDVGTDVNGNAVQLSFNHMGSSVLQPGQTVNPGDLLGGMGDTEGGPHIHLEGWGYCPSAGTYHLLDPQLVVSGYYQSHAVC